MLPWLPGLNEVKLASLLADAPFIICVRLLYWGNFYGFRMTYYT